MASAQEFLLSAKYLEFIAETHPHLELRLDRFEVPSFFAPLDVREPLKPGVLREFATWVTPLVKSIYWTT